ncbi:MAG: hypothetical protein M2R45_00237 [Verrucomicrobia subdivision 3 bacterium]|nr:hypothetical protein [Limisphaerales bacterium]MCS1412305.1 hypothetical protein [Limisphaerales bacterium]
MFGGRGEAAFVGRASRKSCGCREISPDEIGTFGWGTLSSSFTAPVELTNQGFQKKDRATRRGLSFAEIVTNPVLLPH